MSKIPIRRIHPTPEKQVLPGSFAIRNLQDVLAGKDMVQELHRHDFYFILALHKGHGTHEIDFTKYPVQDHSVFILRPGQVHQLALKAGSTGFLMEFDTAFYHPNDKLTIGRLKKAANKNLCELEVERFKKLLAVLSAISIEFTAKEEGYAEAIRAHLDLFFLELVRQSSHPDNASQNISSYTQERFEELLGLLETNITTLKNVAQYAGLLNLSAFQLNAITKAAVGKTVSELINEQIVLEAKRYLLATPNQVKEIADHLGYEDISYFIRFFKKHTGYSPEAFRKTFK
jgi:AraC family transcriptional activator of pobA